MLFEIYFIVTDQKEYLSDQKWIDTDKNTIFSDQKVIQFKW